MILVNNKEDKHIAITILVNAFFEAPNISWMLLQKENKKHWYRFFSVLYYDAAAKNGVFLTKDKKGVLFFYHLKNKNKSLLNVFRKLVVLFFITGVSNGLKAMRHQKNMDQLRPTDGWLGKLVATSGDSEGSAAAYEIKNEMFRVSDLTNMPVYVETTVPRVKLLYRAVGYQPYASLKHPHCDLDIWFMKRNAKMNS